MELIIGEATSGEGVTRNNNPRAVDGVDPNSDISPATKAKASPTLTLRTLPQSSRYFWKASHSEQLSQIVYDKRSDGNKRALPENEVAVMALNEIAAIRGQGFFFHLKNRTCWREAPQECPRSRAPPRPGGKFPNLYYMQYRWTDASRTTFFNTSHRSRYLLCDGLMNPPPGDTLLYAIQYATEKTYPIYSMPTESLVVLASVSAFYLARSSTFEKAIGLWSQKRKPKGADPQFRLNPTPCIWHDPASTQAERLSPFRVPDMPALYDQIVDRCTSYGGPRGLASTFTVDGFWQMIPRPLTPESGIALGTPLVSNDVHHSQSSKSQTRRGLLLQRGRGRQNDESSRLAHSPPSNKSQADAFVQAEDYALPEPDQRPKKRRYRPNSTAEEKERST